MNTRKLIKTGTIIGTATITAVFLLFYRPISLGGDTRYEPVFTGSMEPTIPVGGVVIIKPVDPETLKIGDIICFRLSGPASTTHRIINITDEGFVTKGDANENPDQWTVKNENVIGKVIFAIPYIGYLGYFVRTPVGYITLILIPATLLIIAEIKNIIKHRKEGKHQKENL